MNGNASPRREIVIVGAGLAAHHFLARLLQDADDGFRVAVIGDENRAPYDRSRLAQVLVNEATSDIGLGRAVFRDDRARLIVDDRVLHIDRGARLVRTRSRRVYAYDTLVLATGSQAGREDIAGADLPGCFSFRTVDDAERIRDFIEERTRTLARPLRGAVIGGEIEGIQAALALGSIGIETTVVQERRQLLATDLSFPAASALRAEVEQRGVRVRTNARVTRLDADEAGSVASVEYQDGSFQRVDVVVFAKGARPRDELARNCGLDVYPLGGIVVDERGLTSDPHVFAIGEATVVAGRRPRTASAVCAAADSAADAVNPWGAGHVVRDSGEYRDRVELGGISIVRSDGGGPERRGGISVVLPQRAGVHREVVFSDDASTVRGALALGIGDVESSLTAMLTATRSPAGMIALLQDGSGADAVGPQCLTRAQAHLGVGVPGALGFLATFTRFPHARDCARCTRVVARTLVARCGLSGGYRPDVATPINDRTLSIRDEGGDAYAVRLASVGSNISAAHLLVIGGIAQEFRLQTRADAETGHLELIGVPGAQLAEVVACLTRAELLPPQVWVPERSSNPQEGQWPRPESTWAREGKFPNPVVVADARVESPA